jgi:hypothetical protein
MKETGKVWEHHTPPWLKQVSANIIKDVVFYHGDHARLPSYPLVPSVETRAEALAKPGGSRGRILRKAGI